MRVGQVDSLSHSIALCDRSHKYLYLTGRSLYFFSRGLSYRIASLVSYLFNWHLGSYYAHLSFHDFLEGAFSIISLTSVKNILNRSLNYPSPFFYEKEYREKRNFLENDSKKDLIWGVCGGMVTDFLTQVSLLKDPSMSLFEKAKKVSFRYVDGAPEESIQHQLDYCCSTMMNPFRLIVAASCGRPSDFFDRLKKLENGRFEIFCFKEGGQGHAMCLIKEGDDFVFFNPSLGTYFFSSSKDLISHLSNEFEHWPSDWKCSIYKFIEKQQSTVTWV